MCRWNGDDPGGDFMPSPCAGMGELEDLMSVGVRREGGVDARSPCLWQHALLAQLTSGAKVEPCAFAGFELSTKRVELWLGDVRVAPVEAQELVAVVAGAQEPYLGCSCGFGVRGRYDGRTRWRWGKLGGGVLWGRGWRRLAGEGRLEWWVRGRWRRHGGVPGGYGGRQGTEVGGGDGDSGLGEGRR